ncbi:hypothetical protein QP343_01285 [Lactobacillus jensenii]|uniref:Uncharacterized protein n=3 Tax=Lactobacillus jensenii TaxID=109790 RepID=A0A5N1I6A2_LACJE|nr:hypothetical protein [Lactobacillus jensenii]ERJ44883.1 hypothetical protein N581_01605 [Lactobacillus jensenii MD IIE-70(2)]APT14475.1 hypothetical protein BUE77_03255 [Lactobacillus jensenii]EEQ24969.1 hypothetical protein LACJE0001_0840 [Lactobacillus jensenii 269-3]KAA9236869.1 hypothetical protein F6I36_01410 [Lactobacillus jensenii]KAA9258575.1 hypothetical protein F6I24_04505 [Lactobacillus jensenii]
MKTVTIRNSLIFIIYGLLLDYAIQQVMVLPFYFIALVSIGCIVYLLLKNSSRILTFTIWNVLSLMLLIHIIHSNLKYELGEIVFLLLLIIINRQKQNLFTFHFQLITLVIMSLSIIFLNSKLNIFNASIVAGLFIIGFGVVLFLPKEKSMVFLLLGAILSLVTRFLIGMTQGVTTAVLYFLVIALWLHLDQLLLYSLAWLKQKHVTFDANVIQWSSFVLTFLIGLLGLFATNLNYVSGVSGIWILYSVFMARAKDKFIYFDFSLVITLLLILKINSTIFAIAILVLELLKLVLKTYSQPLPKMYFSLLSCAFIGILALQGTVIVNYRLFIFVLLTFIATILLRLEKGISKLGLVFIQLVLMFVLPLTDSKAVLAFFLAVGIYILVEEVLLLAFKRKISKITSNF